MTNLTIFENADFGKIRTIEINGEPWFVAKDVAQSLGYTWNGVQRIAHVPQEWRGVTSVVTPSGNQEMSILSEQGLYFFLGRSDKSTALPFQKWIAGEVLPQIRKHGGYLTPSKIEEVLLNPDTIIRLATDLKNERQKSATLQEQNSLLEQKEKENTAKIAELQPKAEYTDTILSSQNSVTVTQIAADYKMSAKKLNEILRSQGVQWKVGNQWVLISKYQDSGYTKSATYEYTSNKTGKVTATMSTQWTQKGRLFINTILNKMGIYATVDLSADRQDNNDKQEQLAL